MRHLVQHGGIKFHATPVDFLGGIADVELLLHRQYHDIASRRIVGTVLTFVRLYGTEPALRLNHPVERGMDIHAFLVPKFGHLELLHEFLHPFGLHLRQVGLVDVIYGEGLEEGNDIHAFLLLLAHGLILIRTDLMAVLVLDQHIPIDHGEGFFTFQYMGLQVVRLLEGEVHR